MVMSLRTYGASVYPWYVAGGGMLRVVSFSVYGLGAPALYQLGPWNGFFANLPGTILAVLVLLGLFYFIYQVRCKCHNSADYFEGKPEQP